jgi:zinc protease
METTSMKEPPSEGVRLDSIVARHNATRPPERHVVLEGEGAFGPSLRVAKLRLANGMKLRLQIDSAAPVIALQTWVGVGSRFEKQGKTGICHLFEHLMFGETEGLAHGAFDRLLEEAGAETNAATFLDWTYYQQNLPKAALELALRLEAERFSRLVLREPQVASEKDVVANERRQRVDDDVDGAVSELLYKEAFREHGYGIPTIGWMSDIESFTPEDCLAFYGTYYAPNNATLVLVGDLDAASTLALVDQYFGPLRSSDIPVEDVRPEPPQTSERRIEVTKPTATEKLAIGYRSPALGDFDHAPLTLLGEILFGGRASRMHRKLVKELELAVEARVWVGTFRDPGLFDVGLTAREEIAAEALLEAFDAEMDAIRREPPSESELDRVKARLELATLQSLETVGGRAETIGFNEIVLGDSAASFARLEAYQRVTRSDLLRVARRYLDPSQRTIVVVRPSGETEHGEESDDEEVES